MYIRYITRPEESYRLWRVVVCDQETSNKEAKARCGAVENTTKKGCNAKKTNKQTNILRILQVYVFHTNMPTYKNTRDIHKFYNVLRGVGRSSVAWPKHTKHCRL